MNSGAEIITYEVITLRERYKGVFWQYTYYISSSLNKQTTLLGDSKVNKNDSYRNRDWHI